MIAPKPRVQIGRKKAPPDTPLFPDDAPAPPPPPRRWRGCPLCGTKEGERAHPEHDICAGCASAPEAARERLEHQRHAAITQQHQAAERALRALEALSDEERARWERLCALRLRWEAKEATDEEAALLKRTLRALEGDDPRYSEAFRECHAAGERVYWASAACDGVQKQVNVKLAQLAVCLEDMEAAA